MCGILGFSVNKQSKVDFSFYKKILDKLFLLSESRGKEASGFAFNNGEKIIVHKTPLPACDLIKTDIYKSGLSSLFTDNFITASAIGHSRLVTDGYEHKCENNQPIYKKEMICVHNGIIVNKDQLWEKYSDEEHLSDLDSELIPTLFQKFYSQTKRVSESLSRLYSQIYGMTNIAVFFSEYNNLLLATNNGSIYYTHGNSGNEFVFASERHILNMLIDDLGLSEFFNKQNIFQLKSNTFCIINLDSCLFNVLDFSIPEETVLIPYRNKLPVEEISTGLSNKWIYINTSLEHEEVIVPDKFEEHYNICSQKIAKLKRCSKCLLPETFPFITFDEKGICNYCNNYKHIAFLGESELTKLVSKFKHSDSSPDCLVPFSGGRDSSFTLYYIKKVLKMNPIAFSYDWGMLTDLARRNQSRMCGKLGVEHILVSADIRKKRKNIQKNVSAWLKRPNLGTVPLFMAGDKQYLYYAKLLMNQNNLHLSILGENLLESTKFKSGFCGIKPQFNKTNTYSLSITDKIKMTLYYGKEYLLNPSYLNSSLLDTIDAFRSYYILTHKNINIFNYLKWNEKLIEDTLISEYDWETDPETRTTWRIGDGTAAFYNYIYFIVAGFSENDTFRSNQIKEGMLDRDEAYKYVIEENKPRWNSIKWYLDTVGLDFINTIKIINNIPKLYMRVI